MFSISKALSHRPPPIACQHMCMYSSLRKSYLLNPHIRMYFSTTISLRSPRSFLRRIKRLILKRLVVFRLLFYGSLIMGVSTVLTNCTKLEQERTVTPSFFQLHTSEPGERYRMSGIIKNGSIEIKKGTSDNRFVLSDFRSDILVLYKGSLPYYFKEGDMAHIGGFLADPDDPTTFIATSVSGSHEISVDKYIGETNVDRMTSLNMIEPQTDFEYTKMA